MFLTATLEQNLFQYVLTPIRGNNVLDLIFSNVGNSVVNVGTPDLISDHRIVSADVICPYAPSQSIRDYAHANYNSFNQYLNQVNWFIAFQDCKTVEEKWAKFINIINTGFDIINTDIDIINTDIDIINTGIDIINTDIDIINIGIDIINTGIDIINTDIDIINTAWYWHY